MSRFLAPGNRNSVEIRKTTMPTTTMTQTAMDGGNNSYRRNFLIQRSGGAAGAGGERGNSILPTNFETEPSDGGPT